MTTFSGKISIARNAMTLHGSGRKGAAAMILWLLVAGLVVFLFSLPAMSAGKLAERLFRRASTPRQRPDDGAQPVDRAHALGRATRRLLRPWRASRRTREGRNAVD